MEQKWIARSLTIWGLIVTVVSTAGPVFGPLIGIDVNPADVAEVGAKGTTWINATGALIGSVMVIWGRLRSTTMVTLLPDTSQS